MSYLVLARKYRPKNFESLVGQDHVVRALTHALESQRLHHAYLFTGTRGVGKTTLSRLLAKSFNCETGITAKPCGTCEACLAIDAGQFVDYIEMDGASNRGIDNMLNLLEKAVYAPTSARFKVYMIDEVHMLTQQAFNAMLKTLEEPPEHIKFILATTDPQKIPVTVLSRCLQFNLKQMAPLQIVEYLDYVLGHETITFEKPALRLLADGANGSMRDALSLTDQAISYTAGNISLSAVQDMLGTLDQTYLIRILDGILKKDAKAVMDLADEMAVRSLSYNLALKDLGILLNRIALVQMVPSSLPDDLPEYNDILRFAKLFDEEDVQLLYQIAIHGRNELGLAPDEYAGFTMTLLRMLAFQPDNNPKENINQQESSIHKRSDSSVKKPLSENRAKPQTADVRSFAVKQTIAKEEANKVPEKTADLLSDRTRESQALDWDGDWPALVRTLSVDGLVKQFAQQTELINYKLSGNKVLLYLRLSNEVLASPANIKKLTEELKQRFNFSVEIKTEIGKVNSTARSQAEDAIRNHPYVKELMREFGATIVPDSIKLI